MSIRFVGLLGGSGFIGSRAAEHVDAAGLKATVLDVQASATGRQVNYVDVTDFDSLVQGTVGYDCIVNLAAEHRDDVQPPSRYDTVNVEGAQNVCEAARANGIPTIVFTSTVAVYGFAQPGTDEAGPLSPFNDYGRTKVEAEAIYREWHAEDPGNRSLVIVRPTVVFGEGNRGNVFNLLSQIYSGPFFMVGRGHNRKSMAYVENVAAFIEKALRFSEGIHIYNYVDKPDFDMKGLVEQVNFILGRGRKRPWRVPYIAGYLVGFIIDMLAKVTGSSFPISRIRIQKFCADTSFSSAVHAVGFEPPFSIEEGLERTVRYEFLENNEGPVFYTE